jgi:hypothetical protein
MVHATYFANPTSSVTYMYDPLKQSLTDIQRKLLRQTKRKFALVCAMKAQRGKRIEARFVFKVDPKGCEWSASRLRPFYSRETIPAPTKQRSASAPELFCTAWRRKQLFASARIRTPYRQIRTLDTTLTEHRRRRFKNARISTNVFMAMFTKKNKQRFGLGKGDTTTSL